MVQTSELPPLDLIQRRPLDLGVQDYRVPFVFAPSWNSCGVNATR
jgi:hypothetical protein